VLETPQLQQFQNIQDDTECRRYVYRVVPELGGQSFDNGRTATAWLEALMQSSSIAAAAAVEAPAQGGPAQPVLRAVASLPVRRYADCDVLVRAGATVAWTHAATFPV
jgi:hypothetical protein